jgi:DNA-binding transcriptional ArsR family regulator
VISLAVAAAGWVGSSHPEITQPSNFYHLRDTTRDEAMVVEHLVRLGSRDADKRLAHFLRELLSRLTLVGMADRSGYAYPLTQFHHADALGLTSVHVNRTLRKLREAGLVVMREGRVEIMDLDGLIKLADFDSAYLNQTRPLLV